MSEPQSPPIPYKGLVPYLEEDARFFFGRERDRQIVCGNLLASRLTVLYGSSGVGKSSLLRAGVSAHLRDVARSDAPEATPEYVIVAFSSWQDDPVAGLTSAIRAAIGEQVGTAPPPAQPGRSLAEVLEEWTTRVGSDLLVILDQFEEFFVYRAGQEGLGAFAVEFPDALNRRDLRVNFLISIREDSLAKLDAFKGRIPGLFDNRLRIDHLDRHAALAAIEKPLDRYNALRGQHGAPMRIEKQVVEAVLDQLEAGELIIGEGGQGAVGALAGRPTREQVIEAPYLQLVMRRLWDEEVAAGSPVLRLETLAALGGAERIVRTHLDTAIDALPADRRRTAARIFRFLVTPSGTKIAHTGLDLADYADEAPAAVEEVLRRLSAADVRILRPVPPPTDQTGPVRYEIYHDVLAAAIVDWRARYAREMEIAEAQRRVEAETALEVIHGKLWRLSRELVLESALLTVPLAFAVATAPGVAPALPAGVVAVAAWIGLLALLVSGGTLFQIWKGARAVTRLGFGWRAVVDILADHRGILGGPLAANGALAGWDPSVPPGLRSARLVRAGALVSAAAAPVPALALTLGLSSRGLVDRLTFTPGLVFGPTALLLVVALAAGYLERRAAGRMRRAAHQAAGLLTGAATRGESRQASAPNRMGGTPLRMGRVGTALFAFWMILGGSGLMIATVAIVPWLGQMMWQIAVPFFENAPTKLRMAEIGRGYRLAPDSGISPVEAGRALYALERFGASEPLRAFERPAPGAPAGPWIPAGERDPFGYFPQGLDTIMWQAVRGFSPAQVLFLDRIATHPGHADLRVLARAPRIDYWGARVVPGFTDSLASHWDIPDFGYRRLTAGSAGIGTAALDLSRGRALDAETRLREVISVGLALMDHGTSLIDALGGAVIARRGLKALADLYDVTGRESEARPIRTAQEAAVRLSDEMVVAQQRSLGQTTTDVRGVRHAAVIIVGDSTSPRGLRWEMLWMLATAPCTNAHELAYGPSPDLEAGISAARRDLPRFENERELFDLRFKPMSTPPPGQQWGLFGQAVMALARPTAALLGNERLVGCMGWGIVVGT